jgi:acyl carrier protein
MDEIREKIREFVMDAAQNKGLNAVGDSDLLTEKGIIDSLTIFRLVSFLEDSFGVRIGDDEIVNENFQSIETIESFVAEKLSQKRTPVRP